MLQLPREDITGHNRCMIYHPLLYHRDWVHAGLVGIALCRPGILGPSENQQQARTRMNERWKMRVTYSLWRLCYTEITGVGLMKWVKVSYSTTDGNPKGVVGLCCFGLFIKI